MLGGVFSHVGLPDGKVRKGSYVVKIVAKSSLITQGVTWVAEGNGLKQGV
jgi:uncharacterized protein